MPAFRQVKKLKDRPAEEKAYLEAEPWTEYKEIMGDSPALRRALSKLKRWRRRTPLHQGTLFLDEVGENPPRGSAQAPVRPAKEGI